jgi:CheY-like chemotaxis protein
LRILIVDDDLNMTRTLADILSVFGHFAETATRAAEGLQKMSFTAFDAVVSDIRMPDMNGVEFQRAIRQQHGNLPIMLITAYADHEWLLQARAQGLQAFLEKPFDAFQVVAWANELAARGRAAAAQGRSV